MNDALGYSERICSADTLDDEELREVVELILNQLGLQVVKETTPDYKIIRLRKDV